MTKQSALAIAESELYAHVNDEMEAEGGAEIVVGGERLTIIFLRFREATVRQVQIVLWRARLPLCRQQQAITPRRFK